MRGRVTHTISRGRVVWADGVLDVQPGTGRYIPLVRQAAEQQAKAVCLLFLA